LPTYDAPTPAGQPEVIEVVDFPDDDEDFFVNMPSDFLNTLAAVPTEEYLRERQLLEENYQEPQPQPQPRPQKSLIQNARDYQSTSMQSPPVYQHYQTSTEDLSQLPSWQSMLNNVTGIQM
jgi:hypothetical protein